MTSIRIEDIIRLIKKCYNSNKLECIENNAIRLPDNMKVTYTKCTLTKAWMYTMTCRRRKKAKKAELFGERSVYDFKDGIRI